MRRELFLACLLAASPALAEPLAVEQITGPLSFKSGGQEYVFPELYSPSTDALKPLQGQSIEAQKGRPDRWGRIALTSPATLSLLESGRIQLQPLTAAPDEAARAAEQKAQAARAGLWQDDCCDLLEVNEAGKGLHSWRIVSGTVKGITTRRDTTYVNFGEDWRTDFTVVIPARLARTLEPQQWQSRTIEVRGYVEWRYGPSITLSHAAQIRLPDTTTP